MSKVKVTVYPTVFDGWIKTNFSCTFEKVFKIPKRYIINKNATILFWEDDSKTIVKRMKTNEHNPRLAFLTAYFQKHCGLSKTKANEYLDSLTEENK